ncbi:YqiA/YcfP family alpha/beta fold hydrolase [Catenovulum sediminis]|uniref:YqiA/YcfP family alpha/beta fold hydrolase n=1 Tax=Catenovulum sediminis TaxID=1740262 RepID=UPI00117CA1DC|nr:YqiA/YcfP family alpha/beta fold hydrolase [Catenovulum sediminis]
MQQKSTIIYLHGFLSSPQSQKAQQTVGFIGQHYPDIRVVCPQIPSYPQQIEACLQSLIKQYDDCLLGFIGSSLGGYLATWCAEQTQKSAVLINPAAYPYRLLADYLGEHTNPYTGELFEVTPDFNQALKKFEVKNTDLLKLWVLLETEDETLDYKEAAQKFANNQLEVIKGGNHAFVHYAEYLPAIIQYLLKQHRNTK